MAVGDGDYLVSSIGCSAVDAFEGTRNTVWQCWHFTSLPRTSSGTDRNFRHRRFGQIIWTAMQHLPSVKLEAYSSSRNHRLKAIALETQKPTARTASNIWTNIISPFSIIIIKYIVFNVKHSKSTLNQEACIK